MGILLAFAPFIAFAIVDRVIESSAALFAGAAVSAALLIRDAVVGKTPKILEIGTFILFGCLALYALVGSPTWSVIGVRLCVDTGLLAIVLGSILIGRPFTLQYAREQVAPEFWGRPEFLRTNYIITAAWAVAFALMVAAEFSLLYVPAMPHRAGLLVIILALVAAVKFTGWYPEYVRRQGRATP
jgi:hypothetical protein